MSIIQGNAHTSAGGGYQIERSLRFNSADSAYLNRTPASAGNRRTFTFNQWVKRAELGTRQVLFSAGLSDGHAIELQADNTLSIYANNSASAITLTTTQVFRDPSAWGMLTIAFDTTQATAADRVKIYWNGTQITAFSTATYPSQNVTMEFNDTVPHNIGRRIIGTTFYCGLYMTEINFIDGQALTPSSFGETDTNTGVWKPKAYSSTYGTNGFYLKFADNSGTTSTTLGKDSSGNGNNWTPNNFSVTAGAGNDSLVDSPTAYGTDTGVGGSVRGNYGTWNPLMKASQVTLTNGNLDAAHGTFGTNTGVFGGIAVSSGKWYWEETITALSSGAPFIGIMKPEAITQTFTTMYANTTSGYAYRSTGDKRTNSSDSAYGASYTTNDVIGVALDMDAGTLVFYKNGVSQGTAFSSLSGTFVAADANGTSGGTYSSTINFGQRAFAYTAPSGFKALVTTNLPTPTIGATSTTQANDYFDVSLWTGTGTAQSITNSGSMQPDWVWTKTRSQANDHFLFDAIRGVGNYLRTNSTGAETTVAQTLTSFNSNGFSVGTDNDTNASGRTFVGWQWNAGGSNATNTSGTITSTVRANTTSGFSVVTYTGTGSNATVGHGLGVAPAMIIVKNRGATTDWAVYHRSLTSAAYWLELNSTGGVSGPNSVVFNSTAPTSTVFSVGTNDRTNATNSYIAYCFAAVAGYSAFGSYTGNGSADGPFVYTGFRPRYVLIKDSTQAFNWIVLDTSRDPYNVSQNYLLPNSSAAEGSTALWDILSNGFKYRVAGGAGNTTNDVIIYAAFAEAPFKYSLAR